MKRYMSSRVAGDFQRGGVVIGVEGDPLGLAQVLVQIELDLMVRVVDQPECSRPWMSICLWHSRMTR